MTRDSEDIGKTANGVTAQIGLENQAQLAGWPTPTMRDSTNAANATCTRSNPDSQHHDGWTLIDQSRLAGWATPQSRDHFPAHSDEYVEEKKDEGHGMANLNDQVTLAGWATPSANAFETKDFDRLMARREECKARTGNGNGFGLTLANEARLTASGEGPIGFLLGPNGWAIVRACGQLNPALPRFLMGLPVIFCICAIRASRSLKARKRASSASADTATEFAPAREPGL